MTTQEMSSRSRSDSVKRWREMLASERDAAALYTRLADAETGEREEIFRELASIELQHAAHWEGKLRDAGAAVPAPRGPSGPTPGCTTPTPMPPRAWPRTSAVTRARWAG